jgi:secretion/DNA translocation related TadE-like protein
VRLNDECGAGSVLVIGLVASLLASTSLVVSLAVAYGVKHRAANAADAAALAAADTASGFVSGYPCIAAEKVARLNSVELHSCALDGIESLVSTRSVYLGFEVVAVARAGPPERR